MRQDIEELQRVGSMYQTQAELGKYLQISPRLEFSEGGCDMQAQLSDLEQIDSSLANNHFHTQLSGWVSLELAGHLPAGKGRQGHVQIARQRFKEVAAGKNHVDKETMANYYASKLALASAYAYGNTVEVSIEDNPGYYTELLAEAMSDKEFLHYAPTKRRGLISELTAAALISHAGYLVLPVSMRHDMPRTLERPSVAHDLQVWLRPPKTHFSRPDRKVQVKTCISDDDPTYCESIAMLSIKNNLQETQPQQIARALIRHYSGKSLSYVDRVCLERNVGNVRSLLNKEVGEKRQASFMSYFKLAPYNKRRPVLGQQRTA